VFGWGTARESRFEALEKRLSEMEEAHERVVNLETDWLDYQHKFRNILARLNQRDKALDREEGIAPAPGLQKLNINPLAARLLGFDKDGNS